MNPAAAEALSLARHHGALGEQARLAMLEHAQARRSAILAAHRAGLSMRRIADELSCSSAVVQAAIRAARTDVKV
jgi:hypothetical protein